MTTARHRSIASGLAGCLLLGIAGVAGAVPGRAASLEFRGNYTAWQEFNRQDGGTLGNLHNDLWLETRLRPARNVEILWANFMWLEKDGVRGIGTEEFRATVDTDNFDVRLFGRERPNPTADPLHIFHPNRFGSSNNFGGVEAEYRFAGWKLWGSAIKLSDWGDNHYSLNGRLETSLPVSQSPLKLGVTFSSQVWGKWNELPRSGGRTATAIDAAYQLGPIALTGEAAVFRTDKPAVRAYYLKAQQPIGKATVEATYRNFPPAFKDVDHFVGDPDVLTPGQLSRAMVTYPLAADINSSVALQKFVEEDKTTRTFEAGLQIARPALLSPVLTVKEEKITPASGTAQTKTTYHAEFRLPVPGLQVAKVTGDWTTTVGASTTKAWTLTSEFAYQANERLKLESRARYQNKLQGVPDFFGQATYTVPAWAGYSVSLQLRYGDADFDAGKAGLLRWQLRVDF